MMHVLIIAYEFPPCHSSGVQRTLKFAENLMELGWEVSILTATEDSYEQIDRSQVISDKLTCKVHRAKCLNLKKSLSYKGKYFGFIETFEKVWPWFFTAKKIGMNIIVKKKPDVILSTYPAFTAHCIAYYLVRKFNIPWVMDFRDPLRHHYDLNYRNLNKFFIWLEGVFINRCSSAVFTSDLAKILYENKYPSLDNKLFTIRNGFSSIIPDKSSKEKLLILHSGVLYPNDRNIDEILYAVFDLLQYKPDFRKKLTVRFRGANSTCKQDYLIKTLALEDIFQFCSTISYEESLNEIGSANILLVVQNGVFKNQIPGKIYDYIASKKNIICYVTKDSAVHEIAWEKLVFCYDRKDLFEALLNQINYTDSPVDEENFQEFSRLRSAEKLDRILKNINN